MYYWTLKRMIARGLGGLFVLTIVLYTLFQSRALIEGPQISLITPLQGQTSTSSLILIKGSALHAKELTLDGRAIFIDLAGNFSEQLLLAPGYNIIELTATDVEGRKQKKQVELYYEKQ